MIYSPMHHSQYKMMPHADGAIPKLHSVRKLLLGSVLLGYFIKYSQYHTIASSYFKPEKEI